MTTVKNLLPARLPFLAVAALVLAFLLPFMVSSQMESLLTRALIFAVMAASLDLAYGQAGLISLGHAALAGVGGYTAGLLMVQGGIDSFWIGMLAAGAAAAVASLIFALISLRTKGLYFILVTLALGQGLANLAQQWDVLKTGGAEAVVGIMWPTLGFGEEWNPGTFYQFVLVVCAVAMWIILRIGGSPLGLALRGTRDNDERMQALGYNTYRYRVAALVVSGTLTGMAGALFAYHSGLIAPSNIGLETSGLLVLMVIIGGTGTRYGPALGGIFVVLLEFYATEVSQARAPLLVGLLFIVTALTFRRRAALAAWVRRVTRRSPQHGLT